jgi:hypothetical protein
VKKTGTPTTKEDRKGTPARGVELPSGNFTLVAKADFSTEKLPANLLDIFVRVRAKGREGITMLKLCPRDPKTGKWPYERFLVRQLVKREALRTIPDEKDLSIAKAVAKKTVAKKQDLAKTA